MYRSFCLVAFFGSSLLLSTAQAGLLISNLPGDDGDESIIRNGVFEAMGFTLDPGNDYRLNSVTLRLELLAQGPRFSLPAIPSLEIWNNNMGEPGSLETTLTSPTFAPFGIGNFDFEPSSSFTLTGGSTYWLVATNLERDLNSRSFLWMGSTDPGHEPTGIATHAGSFTGDGVNDDPIEWSPSTIYNSYEIDATLVSAVPEPSSIALMATALFSLGLVVLIRRRRMATA